MNILYILNQFPCLSETFISNEIIELIRLGHNINIISLSKPSDKKIHEKVKEYNLLKKTTYLRQKIDFYKSHSDEEILKGILDIKINIKTKEKLIEILSKEKKEIKKLIRYIFFSLEIIKIIKKNNIKHIHCHFGQRNTFFAYIINKVLGMPYTFTTHACDIFIDPSKDMKKWADNAKKVITISKYNKMYMVDNLEINQNKIKIIHCGIDLDKFVPRKYNSDNNLNILCIGRLVEKKGIKYLIEACKTLKEKKIDFNCNILGDGSLRKEIQDLINNYKLNKNVNLRGMVTQKEVLKEFEKCNVFVLPCIEAQNSDKDGIPVSLMEAMAMELPIISTNLTGIPELIDDNINGIIIKQKDSNAITEAILKIKNNLDFADKIRKKAREKVMKKFNNERNVKKLIKIFEKK